MLHLAEMDSIETTILSTIGNWHGDIYESLHDYALKSNLNKSAVPPYYEKLMRPVIQSNGDGGKFKL